MNHPVYDSVSNYLEFENWFLSNITKCVRVKSINQNFSELKKYYRFLEILVMDFTRTHSELPNQPIVQWLSRVPMRMRSSSICSACSALPALPTSAMQILHGEFFLAISVSQCAMFIIIMIASKGLNLLTLVVKSENLNTTHH